MRALNLVDDRAFLRLAPGEDEVVAIDPYHGDVRRNDDDVEPIQLGGSAAQLVAVPVIPQRRG